MRQKDTERGESVVKVIKSDAVTSLGKDYLEVGIDAALDSGALKDIPFVSTVVGIFNVAGTIKDHILTTKIIKFLDQISEIPVEDRVAMINRLNEDDNFSGKVGTILIEILDRMESEKKPEIAARCFAAFSKEVISFNELRHMLHALERIPTFEIDVIEEFSKAGIQESSSIQESTLLALVNSGLGQNNGGFDGGAILPTKLCKLFVSTGVIGKKNIEKG